MGRAMGRSHEEEGEWILRYGETGEAVLSKHLLRGVTRDGAGEVRQHRLWKASQSSQTLSSIETWKTSILFINITFLNLNEKSTQVSFVGV